MRWCSALFAMHCHSAWFTATMAPICLPVTAMDAFENGTSNQDKCTQSSDLDGTMNMPVAVRCAEGSEASHSTIRQCRCSESCGTCCHKSFTSTEGTQMWRQSLTAFGSWYLFGETALGFCFHAELARCCLALHIIYMYYWHALAWAQTANLQLIARPAFNMCQWNT